MRLRVIGDPIEHSLSPEIHAAFAQACALSVHYDKQRVASEEFISAVDAFRAEGGRGMNVTVPHKVSAFNYATHRDAAVELAGAANTLRFDGDSVQAFNTDGVGLVRDLSERHGVAIKNAKVLILGAGGATRGVIGPLLAQQPASMGIANRTRAKAQDLVELCAELETAADLFALGLDELDAVDPVDLVINATSTGLSGGFEQLSSRLVAPTCYDMSYGQNAVFARWAHKNGAERAIDGLGMLVEQAAESFYLWTGQRPPTQSVYTVLQRQFR